MILFVVIYLSQFIKTKELADKVGINIQAVNKWSTRNDSAASLVQYLNGVGDGEGAPCNLSAHTLTRFTLGSASQQLIMLTAT